MEEQAVPTVETTIVETNKFDGTASVGNDVRIYRRLEDRYDKTAIAMINNKGEVIGYLNREIAEDTIFPYLKRGLKFRCVVTGAPNEEGDLPIEIYPILSERAKQMRREANSISSLKGVGSVSEEYFKSIGINTDVELIQRVESSSTQAIYEEIRQENPGARLSASQIERIYENAKAKHLPTSEEIGASLEEDRA
jgi:hypothetical protein